MTLKFYSFGLMLLMGQFIYAQCEVTATAVPTDITCGTCVTLTAFGEGQGNSVFTESFNSGAPTGWQSTAQATYTNPCDPSGVDGTTHLWMGDATGVPRQMTTAPFDFSTATAGATICFDMLFAEQGDASPCEGPDEPDEGVYVQYSTDGGATWIDIHYFDPNGGNDNSLVNWNNWCFALPPGALTANTQIRWFQDNDSGADYDHWGIDNVNLYFNDPTYEITWQHDGYSYGIGNGGGDNPTPVCPQTTTTYVVTMTNGTTVCSDSVTINVAPPTFDISAGPDTTVCEGQCVDLQGDATIVVSPAKTPTYENSEISALAGLPSAADLVNLLLPCTSFGGCTCPDGSSVNFLESCPTVFTGSLSMNINITDLNTTMLSTGELTSVCIGDALMVVGDLTPFEVNLTCPSGTSIVLANAGDLTGTNLTNTCFDLNSTTLVASGTPPYNGTFQPVEPLTNLNGCDANGVWTLTFEGTFDLSSGNLPIGFLNGWEISFDDPEINYEGLFSWSPTTGLSDPNVLNPTVCPTSTTTYTLSVTDSSNCAVATDDVTLNVTPGNCCPFEIDYLPTNPTCGNMDGAIDVTILNPTSDLIFEWDNNATTEDISGLGSGTYVLTVTDTVLNCSKDTSITITAPNAPLIDSVAVTGTSCGMMNGSITVIASGGTGTLNYSIDNGVTTQTGNVFNGLSAGNYSITVIDGAGCDVSANATVASSNALVLDSVSLTPTTCGNTNGSLEIVVSGGNGPLSYSIDNGITFGANNTFNNLNAGTYDIVVNDSSGCSVTDVVSITASQTVAIDSVSTNPPSCGAADGSLAVFVSTGQAPYSYSIDNGLSFQASNTFNSLGAGAYAVVVVDDANCSDTLSVTLSSANAPSINNVSVTIDSCATMNGTILVEASGNGALMYSLDNGVTFQMDSLFEGLQAGNYTVIVADALGCESFENVAVTGTELPVITALNTTLEQCGGGDGEIFVTATSASPMQYSLDSVTFVNNSTFSGLDAGNYTVYVINDDDCAVSQSVLVDSIVAPEIFDIIIDTPSCGQTNGSVTIVSNAFATIIFSIDGGATFQPGGQFDNLPNGTYNIIVSAFGSANCSVDSVVVLGTSDGPSIDNIAITDETCLGENDGSIDVSISNGQAPYTITLNGDTASAMNQNLSPGNYVIEVFDADDCVITENASIAPGISVSISTIGDTSILANEDLVLETVVTGSDSGAYNWSPANEYLNCSDCAAPIFNGTESAIYTVSYADDVSNCMASDNVVIEIIPETPICQFPTAFSPNGDGVNDIFQAICNDIVLVDLRVYNRWGGLVFHQMGTDNIGWDGTFRSLEQPLGVYTYSVTLEYEDGEVEQKKGNVSLIR